MTRLRPLSSSPIWNRFHCFTLIAVVLGGTIPALALRPVNLRCEYEENPIGIGTTAPRFSWQLESPRRGAKQMAYQIVVTSATRSGDAETILWDTGRVESDRSTLIPYGGKPLAGGQTCHWKVRVWDDEGELFESAQPASFEMTLLEPSAWKARWIGAPEDLRREGPSIRSGQWIWNPRSEGEGALAFFRVPITIDDGDKAESAIVKVTADDKYQVFVNGHKVGEGSDFRAAGRYDIASRLQEGRNLIAIRAQNTTGPTGMIAAIGIRTNKGKQIRLSSDGTWKTFNAEAAGWALADFDDSGWETAKVVAPYGAEPWKEVRENDGARRSILMRKEFELKGKVIRARAYASGLGLYELHLNGQKVGADVFAPGWTHYPKRVYFQTYDVTPLLRSGTNAAGAILGNGWWSGGMGWEGAERYPECDLRFILQLHVEYEDGTSDLLVTDDTWQAHVSPITRDSFYHGERYDARLETPGWDRPGFGGEGWSQVTQMNVPLEVLRPQVGPSIRVTQDLPARQVTEVDKGVFMFDFGQNAAGRPRLKVKGPAGTTVRLRYAEVLHPDGKLYRDNYRTAQATDEYVLKGDGEEVWEPRFTYRGARYCEVTGYPGTPSLDTLTFRVLHSAPPMAGEFECSDWIMNQIFQNVRWGQRSNLHSVPTDCPQRDERLGWMGDAQAFAPASCWNMEMAGFYSKWMHDITDSQFEDGAVTDVSPKLVVNGPAAPGWGDAVVIIPWTVYRFYGDTRILEENYDSMKRWVDYMHRHSKDGLYEREGYGDWVSVVPSPKKPIGAGYCYYSTRLLAQMARVVGRDEDALKYAEAAEKIAAAYNRAYLNPSNNQYLGQTQTANILPLFFGIVPRDRQSAVVKNIVDDIVQRDYHLSTGFMGTTYLMPVLAMHGQQEVAYRLAQQTTYPSWGYMVRNGATTIWELWDADKQGPNMNSRNHFAFGAVSQWFFEDVAGIQVDEDEPGFRRFIIRPQPGGGVSWAKATYPSIRGVIRSEWKRTDDGGLWLHVVIPANTVATVHLPTLDMKEYEIVESGKAVARNGRKHRSVDGIEFVKADGKTVVFQVQSGEYAFVVKAKD